MSVEASKITDHANTNITEEYTIVHLKRQELTRRIQEKLAAAAGKSTHETAAGIDTRRAGGPAQPGARAAGHSSGAVGTCGQ